MARTARRQLLLDRWTEKLERGGYPHAAERARDLITDMDDLGFTLPEALDDPPPLAGRGADPDHRAACMEQIRTDLANRRLPAMTTTSGRNDAHRTTLPTADSRGTTA